MTDLYNELVTSIPSTANTLRAGHVGFEAHLNHFQMPEYNTIDQFRPNEVVRFRVHSSSERNGGLQGACTIRGKGRSEGPLIWWIVEMTEPDAIRVLGSLYRGFRFLEMDGLELRKF
jgi:hypothetical protein